MTTATLTRNTDRRITFEELKGLRAQGYIRDSTLDQKDGFGPGIQRRAIDAFARSYGLLLGNAWYTDFITGTSTLKRSGFHQVLAEAQIDRFDVLLVYHTSRFARNRADAIRYKAELRKLGKTVVFVSQGIISGNDNDFLNEGINEVLDEHYSRNLSRWVADGLRVKHEEGIANGKPPLGYRSEKLDNGKRERKVLNPETMPALLELLHCYASGRYSYQSLADHLNSRGYRNRIGKPFTKGSVEHILSNRFYEGKAVFHPGEPDEEVRQGTHEVPEEMQHLWHKCQQVKCARTSQKEGHPRLPRRAYPFTMIAKCDRCGLSYAGQPVHRDGGHVVRRLYHKRPFCDLTPHSVRVERLMAQFQEGVLPYIVLDHEWQTAILQALRAEAGGQNDDQEISRLERALANLRKQHLWGDVTDEEYQRQKQDFERQLKALASSPVAVHLPNLEQAAGYLNNLPALWVHPGVTDEQREALIREVFQQVKLQGSDLIAVEPKPEYQPLFAYIVTEGVRKCRGEWI